jgi:putative endopeptidase
MAPIDPERFDKSVRPADDFFQYINGGWIAKNPIPADESRWGSFNILRRMVDEQLKNIFDDIAAKDAVTPGSAEQKVRDFYRCAMDLEKRNKDGVTPLASLFQAVDALKTTADIGHLTGVLQRAGIGPFWNVFIEQDEKNSEVMALHWWQGGLSLPDRDYYLKDDEKSKKIREAYLVYMHDMLTRTALATDVAGTVAAIMELETRLAKASLTRVELRDVEKMYHKITPGEFATLAPEISLSGYFEAIALAMPAYLIVGQPQFFAEVSKIFKETSLDTIRAYFRWQTLDSFANYLSEDLEKRHFDFYGRLLNGVQEMKPLWRRALSATNNALDEMIGQIYVAKHFSEDAKKKIYELVEHLMVAYRARIEKLSWMSAETKQNALKKLGTISRKLGYPDVWKDMSGLTIGTDSYVENAMRAHAFEFDRRMKEAGGPVNRAEWLMSPQTVNAYYMPPMNDIAFPAAILQPPFFDPNASDAMNFGAIGAIIGHELTHGFDDQGSRFDEHGNLHEWWMEEDRKQFTDRANRLAEQFDKYEPIPGVKINGKLTLGENIADLGGLLIAWDGLQLLLQEKKTAEERVDGFTPGEQFFISAAIAECGQERDEALRLQVQVDPHSPSKFRVNPPFSNMDPFYETFGVKAGDALYRTPEDRVRIW